MKQFICVVAAAVMLPFLYVIMNNVQNRNNVCKTLGDYYTNRDNNTNCYHNPDYLLTVPEMIQRYGYPLELHNVTTTDGHILTMFRIPHAKNVSPLKHGKPVLLMHGFLSNCAVFVNIGQKSLGFVLADEGYDVWLGNFRGTMYSKNHIHLSRSESKYWNFSFHEYGIYDVKAKVDYVANITNVKVTYIGFSIGTTAFFVYATTYPDLASRLVDVSISLAPTVYPLKANTLLTYFNLFEVQEFLPSIVSHAYDALPLKTFIHLGQIEVSQEFSHYDYGLESNLKEYGTPGVPPYNLTQLKTNMYLIRAAHDLLISEKAVERLHRTLPKNINPYNIYVIRNKNFGHSDFFKWKSSL